MIELEDGDRVLVMGPNWLGDALMAEPAVRALALAKPQLKVSLALPQALAPLFQSGPENLEVFPIETKGKHAGLGGRFRLWGDLKALQPAATLTLRNSFGAALDAARTGAAHTIGYAGFGRGPFLSHPLPLPPDFKEVHRTRSYLRLLEPLGVEYDAEATPDAPVLAVLPEAAEKAKALIEREGGPPTHPLVALHPGASYGPAKMWGEPKFAALADRIIEEQGGTVLVLGGPGEVELASAVIGSMREGDAREGAVRNLAEATPDLQTLAAVMAACDLVVGNDSGPLHLAAATGVPCIAIYGSTSSDFTGIRGAGARTIWERVDCSPCFKRECPKEDYMACMDAIPAAKVWTQITELLGFVEPDFEEIQRTEGDTEGVKDRGQ